MIGLASPSFPVGCFLQLSKKKKQYQPEQESLVPCGNEGFQRELGIWFGTAVISGTQWSHQGP